MGKGQRARALRAVEKEARKIEAAKKAKKRKAAFISSSIVAAVLVVTIVSGLIYSAVYASRYSRGEIQRGTVVMKSEHYTVDAAMMSYFFYTQYNSFINNYSSLMSYIQLDTSKSLKKQTSSFDKNGGTWFDYFSAQAGDQVRELIYLAEKAIGEGMKLTEKDQENIQKNIDDYATHAEEAGYKAEDFLSAVFGTGVREDDVRKCLELSVLADKYYQQYINSLQYTDERLESYYTENIDTYRYVDYYAYSISASDTADSETYAAAEASAKELAAVTNADAFKTWVEQYVRANNPITEENTEDDLKKTVETALSGLEHQRATYSENDDGLEWLFKEAKVGETHIVDDESGTYSVYLCTATPHRDEEATRTIREIVLTKDAFDSKEKAQERAKALLAEMTEAGLTEETFKAYAAANSEDTATASNGGLCENYRQSAFDEKIGAWAYSDARKAGDFEAVEIDDGWAVCYYVGTGAAGWKADCISALRNEDYEAARKSWGEKITLTENAKGYNKIPDNV